MPSLRYENYDPNSDLSSHEKSRITSALSFQFAIMIYAQFPVNYELLNYKDGSDNQTNEYLNYKQYFKNKSKS